MAKRHIAGSTRPVLGDPWGLALCLEGLAAVAALRADPHRAARLSSVADRLRQAPARPFHRPQPAIAGAAGPLTPREREVVARIAIGWTNREIAEALIVSERTGDAHVDHIRGKLGVRSRAQIAAWAVANGLADTSVN